ncbi:FAD-dependent oxidoreductase [Rhizobium sp. NXC24]|uniref:FAD-dependent oxidoreductase n=1 Tax=Rhizobium sp. NXC24 TaxID=2048897 RepID=UPI000CDF52B3|nr:FAD-dependent oxidoreductase [Rhizobium sp. NXC24]AVA25702.1 glucose-methanol-choline oxidoreductase protein [Rhizobium sp. NXC24]
MFAGPEVFQHGFDVCVVGAGPVGIAAALELSRRGMRTLLIEAGPKQSKRPERNETGFDIDDDIYHAADQVTSATGLGGTSERWGGQCVELDDIDFEARDYVAHSGWPIAHEKISPFYQRARSLLSSNVTGERSDPDSETDFPASRESWTRIRNTAKANRAELTSSQNLFVILDARVKALGFDPVQGRLHSISIGCRGGSYKVCAEHYVLACGGRGNTRLLLNLQVAYPQLFGGSDGPLGRFYMGHLAGQIAQIEFTTKEHAERYLFKRTSTGTFVCNRFQPGPKLQRTLKLPNIAFWPTNRRAAFGEADAALSLLYLWNSKKAVVHKATWGEADRSRYYNVLQNVLRHPIGATFSALELLRQKYGVAEPYLVLRRPDLKYGLRYHGEQIPSSSNRAFLKPEQDADGQFKLEVSFRYLPQDISGTLNAHLALDRWLKERKIGKLIFDTAPEHLEEHIDAQAKDGYHQIGLTKMGVDRKHAVVNHNCRIIDIDNLYVAGSCIFPTSGQANPTLPAVAFAVRLADHLVTEIRRQSTPAALTMSSRLEPKVASSLSVPRSIC